MRYACFGQEPVRQGQLKDRLPVHRHELQVHPASHMDAG
ncbi:Uncharacterised protein [Vibrio cholerae]|nr:Uncharacterised protein [Vibrio cholerae]CSI23807.1 Uncharacterised protein [Vibrio cholerae]CSI45646.1 Uncharacterised protein [Vibrio cholerae]